MAHNYGTKERNYINKLESIASRRRRERGRAAVVAVAAMMRRRMTMVIAMRMTAKVMVPAKRSLPAHRLEMDAWTE